MIQAARKKRSRAKGRAPQVRVAAYARISVADREATAFSSVEAQVESIDAYIKSQAANGWGLAGEPYVDDGFTGANTRRPGLQQLLDEIKRGTIDTVVVHRFDRFSRSQRDFLNLLHVLERHEVAFVSVSEAVDTGTPMGRCMLAVISAFAQLERETIAERTRVKIHAARRRGMWTGGRPVLGYDIEDKHLVVNVAEAEQVRAIFALYRELGSLMPVVRELGRRGWSTKGWTNAAGTTVEGRPFTKSSLHSLLRNPLYVGRIRAGDELCDAQHDAIVDRATWDAVQAQLAEQAVQEPEQRRPWRPSKSGGLLQGLVQCAVCSSPFSYHYTSKRTRRYAYLVCAKALKEGAAACRGSRVAVGEFESFVVSRIRAIGRDPAVLEATLAAAGKLRRQDRDELARALAELDPIWAELFPAERARVLALLIDRITFNAPKGDVEITFREGGPKALLANTEAPA